MRVSIRAIPGRRRTELRSPAGRSAGGSVPVVPTPTYDDDLRLAHVLAYTADAQTMDRFRALDLRVEPKPDLTPVSDADRAVEEAMRATLRRVRPRDAV